MALASVIVSSTEAVKIDHLGEIFRLAVVTDELGYALHVISDAPTCLLEQRHPKGFTAFRVCR